MYSVKYFTIADPSRLRYYAVSTGKHVLTELIIFPEDGGNMLPRKIGKSSL
jgi:hypothetical protein